MEKAPRKVVSSACDLCKAGKRRCDGKKPCAYCIKGNKDCSYTHVDKRRRKTATSPPPSLKQGFSPTPSTSALPAAEVSNAPSAFSHPSLFGSTSILNPSPTFSTAPSNLEPRAGPSSSAFVAAFAPSPTSALFPHAPATSAPPREDEHNDEALASLARAIGDDTVQHASPAVPTDSSNPIEGIHRHLVAVFSLRSLPQGADEDDSLFEKEGDLSSFFLPSQEEGLVFVKCFFEHAASTYRYLDEQETSDLAHSFFAQDPSVLDDALLSALVLVVMAVGCLWTASYIGADPKVMTPRAIKLYLASKRRLAKTSVVPPRLVAVQLHLATTHLLLGLGRYQSAWLSFGTAGRLTLLLGLHRASPPTTPSEVDAKRRRVYWSAFMMDRFLSLIIGLPPLFNEVDITQPYPQLDGPVSPQAASASDSHKMLIGSVAHFKLCRIMGHALDSLRTPKDLSQADRAFRVVAIETELEQWQRETPAFFHPETETTGSDMAGFAQIAPVFERQQWRVRSTYQYIRLLLYRSSLLDELLNRFRRGPTSGATTPTVEMKACVDAALYIATTAAEMQGRSLSGGTFWNTAFFAFSSVAALLVFLALYPDSPDCGKIESVIERAMRNNEAFGAEAGATARQQLLQETRRISALLRPGPPAEQGQEAAYASSSGGITTGLGQTDGEGAFPDLTLPFLFSSGIEGGETSNGDWASTWEDIQALVEGGFDTQQQFFPPTF